METDVELVLDGGPCGTTPTTVVDLTGAAPEVVREGKGSVAAFLR
jgi:tRNA A37 threonylcarbamoyladenosine synthetase subunit TsaC/SUA5/YrdC